MSGRLAGEIRQTKPFGSVAEEALLNIHRTASLLSLAFAASLGSALLPGTYRLDPSGVTLGVGPFARHRPWDDMRRAVRSSEGVLLSPFATRRWLDAYRAVFLPLPRRGDPALTERVTRLLVEHGL